MKGGGFLNKILLTPKDQTVQITDAPSDKVLLVLFEALKEGSMSTLLSEKVQRLLPLRMRTNQSVDGEQRQAILEIIPQKVSRLPDGEGWSLHGQSTSESDFAKRGEQVRAPVAQVVLGSSVGDAYFSVV